VFKVGDKVKEKRPSYGPRKASMTVVAVGERGHLWCEWEENGHVHEHKFMPLELKPVSR
jgi:uncharacterized protein YodC (DUF2158 family)